MHQQIAENIDWVGVVDWELQHFHGHELSTQRGSSYNAYLIRDEKNVLVDTVWSPFTEEFMRTLGEIIDPADLDYVVANHSEIDHAGAMTELMRHASDAQVIVSQRGLDSFAGNYHHDWDIRAVETGDTLDIGDNELVFIEAPMLHWPDSMFTYVSGANILMPNDAFGQHYATSGRFNDEVSQEELWYEALKYYVNILTPFSRQVKKKIDELVEMDVPVDMIAPSHGVIWRDEPMQIVEKYAEWADQQPEQRAVILYDTMWDATGKMARAIGEGLDEAGIPYKIHHMAVSDRNDVLVDVFKARTIAVGSPTFNLGVLGGVTPILEEMRGLKLQNKLGAAFGSYGWAPKSVDIIEDILKQGGFEIVKDGLLCKWQPDEGQIEECRAFGRDLAEATKKPVN